MTWSDSSHAATDKANGTDADRLIVFEGVDGVGKSTLARALQRHLLAAQPDRPVAVGSFPGSTPGSLGRLVYDIQHDRLEGVARGGIDQSAMQLLHVAAHVDAINGWIAAGLLEGRVVLDRFWWSTYAYSRHHLSEAHAMALVAGEMPFWAEMPPPTIFLIRRRRTFKPDEIDAARHAELDRYYGEVARAQAHVGVRVHTLDNDSTLDYLWRLVLDRLSLPYASL